MLRERCWCRAASPGHGSRSQCTLDCRSCCPGVPPTPPSKGYKQPQPWTEGERCWLRHPPGLGVLGAPELGTGQGFLYPQRAPEREKGFSAEDDPKVNPNATECQENNAQACREELQ